MVYVYVVKRGQLMNGRYEFHATNIYSSEKIARQSIANSLEVNKATNVVVDELTFGGNNVKFTEQTTYNTISTDGRMFSARIVLEKVVVEK